MLNGSPRIIRLQGTPHHSTPALRYYIVFFYMRDEHRGHAHCMLACMHAQTTPLANGNNAHDSMERSQGTPNHSVFTNHFASTKARCAPPSCFGGCFEGQDSCASPTAQPLHCLNSQPRTLCSSHQPEHSMPPAHQPPQ